MDFSLLRDPDADDARFALMTAVAKHGLDSPSLRELARTAHRSPSTLLDRFGSKAQLHRRSLGALGVRWNRTLEDHPVVGEEAADLARLRVAFEELARSDSATADMLDEVIEMERLHLARWLLRYVPMPSFRQTIQVSPVPAVIVDALHAIVLGLWDVRRHPDRMAARALFEDWAVIVVLGAERLSAVRGTSARAEQMSGDGSVVPEAEQMSGDDEDLLETGQTFEEATRLPYTIIRS